MKDKIVIGTRGSKLALWQANWVKNNLMERCRGIDIFIEIIKTKGDKILDVPLANIGGKGLFVKEIEDSLMDGKIDIAVHSMKDVPAVLPDGLVIAAVPEREDPRDALISREGKRMIDLKQGAHIGTSSLRRKSQLLNIEPSFKILQLRGNLDTRLRKLDEGMFDAIVAAAAGLCRMGWKERITEYLPFEKFLPAIGQGALGIEARKDDSELLNILKGFNCLKTSVAVTAERAFLKRLEGGCQVPIAAYAAVTGDPPVEIRLDGMVSSIDGKRLIRKSSGDSPDNACDLGNRLAETLLNSGADVILDEVYGR